jgi:hypothetical protein
MIGPRLRMGVHFFPVETSLHRIGAQTTYSISATLNTALSSIAQVPHTGKVPGPFPPAHKAPPESRLFLLLLICVLMDQ